MLGVAVCKTPSLGLGKFKLRGHFGAFVLGLLYGILSGACTFGFIAPILAIITVQEKIITGLILIVVFALGHCLPIVVAGSSVGLTQRFLENKGMNAFVKWGRKLAAFLIAAVGFYIIINHFLAR